MAEVAVHAAIKVLENVLAGKLVKLAVSGSSTFSNIKASMNNISSELRVMKEYLDEVNIDDESNKTHVAWIKEVQNLAYRIEDVVAEFKYLVGKNKFDGISIYRTTILTRPKAFVVLKRIAAELLETEKSLKRLGEIKERWVTRTDMKISKNSNDYSHYAAVSAHLIDEDNIVGIGENTKLLTNCINSTAANLSIISVWGMGGVGKTTLVTNVFRRERERFDCHAWIYISQSYTIENILRDIIFEICKSEQCAPKNTMNMDLRGLKELLRFLLSGKKYMIILDDVWDAKAFQDLSDTFIDNHVGSYIIITTRMIEVASLAAEFNRLEVKTLRENESWKLFCKKAFYRENNFECPPSLQKWAEEIVSKCNGLPLALVSLGGLLSLSEKTELEWKRIYHQLSWELDNNPKLDHLKAILNLSFKYLPGYLKNCFLYCSMFPEDSLLPRKKLIRLWIAEGFVEEKGQSALEEVAERYLTELVHRSMLQVVTKNYFGRVKRCKMHDTLRELAISLCKKRNFGLVSENDMPINVDAHTRRLSVVKLREGIRADVCLPQLKTFMSVDSTVLSSPLLSMIFDKSRFLTVLDVEGLPIEKVSDSIGNLFNLHYLGLRSTNVKALPNSIRKLQNLQTLDLCLSKIQKLPDGIAELKNLRHLFAEVVVDWTDKRTRNRTGINLPKEMFLLKELQTIQALESSAIAVRQLCNLTLLRSLRVRNVKAHHSAELCRAISNMRYLSFLSIYANNENEFLHLDSLNLERIQKLEISGRLTENMLESPMFKSGEHIQTLFLAWSQLQNQPLQSLCNMKNLAYLFLLRAYDGPKLVFKAGWFPKMKRLILRDMPNLVQVEMEHGTMVSLEEVFLWQLEKLEDFPKGVKHLISLKRIGCRDMPPFFGGLVPGNHRILHFTCQVV